MHLAALLVDAPLRGLALMAVLLFGVGTGIVHEAHHALEWADAQTSHEADHHREGGERAQAPCVHGDTHVIDCAVCSGLSAFALGPEGDVDIVTSDTQQMAAREAYADMRRAVSPARGPPAVA